MNFTKYFKRKNYDNLDRFLMQQKGQSFRDPFEGDPFKIQSLNFRYADKPIFYPISNRSKLLANAEKAQVKSLYYNQPSHQRFEKDNRAFENVRRSSSICSFSDKQKNEKRAENLLPFQRKTTAPKKFEFNRSRSFICPLIPAQLKEGAEPSSGNQNVLKNNTLKPKNIGTNRSMTAINVDHRGGCEITIQINGVPGSQVYVKENFENLNTAKSRLEPIKKTISPTVASPYELKPSRSYVIRRDESTPDVSCSRSKSSKKLLRNCSTHSMIPHREEKNTSQEFNAFLSDVDTTRLNLGSESRESSHQLKKTKTSNYFSSESFSRTKSLAPPVTIPKRNWERRASMLERILSNNPIVAPPRNGTLLTRSKSVLDQRFTPLPITGKYQFEQKSSKIR